MFSSSSSHSLSPSSSSLSPYSSSSSSPSSHSSSLHSSSHFSSYHKKYSNFSLNQIIKYSKWFLLLSKSKTGTIEIEYLSNILLSTTLIKNKKDFLIMCKDLKSYENGLITFEDFLDILTININSKKIQIHKLDKLIDTETNLSPDTIVSVERRKLLMEHVVDRTALRGWGMDLTELNDKKRLLRHNTTTQLMTHKVLKKNNTLDELSKLHEKHKQEASEVIWELSDGLKRERDVLHTIDCKRRENEYRKQNSLKYSKNTLPIILPLDDLITNSKLLESINSEEFAELFEKKVLPENLIQQNNRENKELDELEESEEFEEEELGEEERDDNDNSENNDNSNNIQYIIQNDDQQSNNINKNDENENKNDNEDDNNTQNNINNTNIESEFQDDDNDSPRSNCSSLDNEMNLSNDWIIALSKSTPRITKSFDSIDSNSTLPSINLPSSQAIDCILTQKTNEKRHSDLSLSSSLSTSTSSTSSSSNIIIPISNNSSHSLNTTIKFSPPRNEFCIRSQKISSAPLRRVSSHNTLSSLSSSLSSSSSRPTTTTTTTTTITTPTNKTIVPLLPSTKLSSSPLSSSRLILPNTSRSISPITPHTSRSKQLLKNYCSMASLSTISSKSDKFQDDNISETSISLDISNEVLAIHPIEQYTPVSIPNSFPNKTNSNEKILMKPITTLFVRQLSPIQRTQHSNRPSTSEKSKRDTICSQLRY